MAIRPDFDERVSALRARAEAIRAAIWDPLANTGGPGRRESADLVVAGMIVALMLVAVFAGLF